MWKFSHLGILLSCCFARKLLVKLSVKVLAKLLVKLFNQFSLKLKADGKYTCLDLLSQQDQLKSKTYGERGVQRASQVCERVLEGCSSPAAAAAAAVATQTIASLSWFPGRTPSPSVSQQTSPLASLSGFPNLADKHLQGFLTLPCLSKSDPTFNLADKHGLLFKHIHPVCCLGVLSGNLKFRSAFAFCIKRTVDTSQGRVQKTEVNFRGESFNVTSGCPSKNPEVLRWSFPPNVQVHKDFLEHLHSSICLSARSPARKH